jgi:hypothetical protein
MRRKILGVVSAGALTAGLLLSGLTSSIALADGTVTWNGQNGLDALNSNQCQDAAANDGTMLWIFNAGQGDDVSSVTLNWDTGQTADGTRQSNGSWHITTAFFDPTAAANSPVTLTYVGNLGKNPVLTISGCNEGGGGSNSDLTTEIHLGADDTSGTTIVSGPVDFGGTVHDSASLSFSSGSLPTGSFIMFAFWANGDCGVDEQASADDSSGAYDVGGDTSPAVVDPGLVESSLGTGDYSFQAYFTSGDTAAFLDESSACEPFSVGAAPAESSEITTEIHLGANDDSGTTVVGSSVDLGSTIHDSAHLTFTGGGTLPASSSVVFKFWAGTGCPDSAATYTSGSIDVGGDSSPVDLDPELAEGPLSAGNYAYEAIFTSGDTDLVTSNASDCEPFSVNQAGSNTSTSVVRDDNGTAVALGGNVPVGTAVHDTATVGTTVGGITISGTVTYHFFYNQSADPNCGASYEVGSLNGKTWPQAKTMSGGLVPNSQSTGALLVPGYYSFDAVYGADSNYTGSTSACEPFNVFNGALTIGYWSNHLDATLKKGKPNAACSNLPNGTSCSTNGPWTFPYLGTTICTNCIVGTLSASYTAKTTLDAAKVFGANNCANASTSDSNAAACLAAQLLGAELNVANGANNCACSIIGQAKSFLSAVGYAGPGSKVTFNATHTRAMAISLKTLLDNYNNNKGC